MITAILADDFTGEIERWAPFGGPFDAQRVGSSRAVAKNLDQTGDCSRVVIVFDGGPWRESQDPAAAILQAQIVAHELAHPIIDRASYASGAMAGVQLPSVTAHEGARSASRILAGEYRADRMAEIVVQNLGASEIDGAMRPIHSWLLRGRDYLDELRNVVAQAHPGWPDIVDRYRNREIALEAMWLAVARAVDQTVTLIVHAQLLADSADVGIDVLSHPDLRVLPAMSLYLAEPLAPFIELVRSTPPLIPIGRTKEVQSEIERVGAADYLDIWSRLGIRPRDLPRPSLYLDVQAPLR